MRTVKFCTSWGCLRTFSVRPLLLRTLCWIRDPHDCHEGRGPKREVAEMTYIRLSSLKSQGACNIPGKHSFPQDKDQGVSHRHADLEKRLKNGAGHPSLAKLHSVNAISILCAFGSASHIWSRLIILNHKDNSILWLPSVVRQPVIWAAQKTRTGELHQSEARLTK